METQVVHFSQAAFVTPFVSYLENLGIDTGPYLVRAGISPTLLANESNPVPVRMIHDFVNTVSLEYQINDLGILVGSKCSAQTFGEMGEILLTAGNVREYLVAGCQLIRSFSSGDHYWMDYDIKPSRFCLSLSGRSDADKIQTTLFIFLATINTIRDGIGEPWLPASITIPGMSLATAAHLAETLPHSSVSVDGAFASFTVPEDILNRDMRDLTKTTSSYSISSYPTSAPADFLSSLKKLVRTLIISGRTDIETAALASGFSKRRLQRRLAECGASYSSILLASKIALAKQWLSEDRQPLGEVALRLGYSDPANFTRAFRRVVGVSPSQYLSTLDEDKSG